MANGYGSSSSSSSSRMSSSSSNTRQSTTNAQGEAAPVGFHYMPDGSLMSDLEHARMYGEKTIYSLSMDFSDLQAESSVRNFSVIGDQGSKFSVEILNEDNYYYNFTTKLFSSTKYTLKVEMTSGSYVNSIVFPTVTDNDEYNISLMAEENTKHSNYREKRFEDGSLDINSSIGSNSFLLKKVIYQYTDLTLTIANTSANSTISLTNTSDTFTLQRNKTGYKTAFSISCSSASTESFRILKQPSVDDILSFVSLTVGSAPELLRGENEFPAVTSSGKVSPAVSSSTTVTVANLSATPLVGDKFFITDAPNSVSPQIADAVSVTEGSGNVTSSVAVTVSNLKGIQFSNRKNYQWPVDNILKIKPGMIVFGNVNITADTIVSEYEDSTTIFADTSLEKTIINNRSEATNTKNQKPTIVNGVVTVQPGNVIFSNQQLLSLAGQTIKIGGYGLRNVLSVTGYEIKFSDLKIALTPITTTTTASSSASTSVVVSARDGIINGVSTVSGIGIDSFTAVPTVSSGGNATGAGTIVLSAAQTLESGITLAFGEGGKVATITGNIEIIKAGDSNATVYFDVERFLSAT
jgi:hypothetical protein